MGGENPPKICIQNDNYCLADLFNGHSFENIAIYEKYSYCMYANRNDALRNPVDLLFEIPNYWLDLDEILINMEITGQISQDQTISTSELLVDKYVSVFDFKHNYEKCADRQTPPPVFALM